MHDPSAEVATAVRPRFFYGWWLIAVSAIGIMLSAGSVLTFTFGVFILPLSQEFGWSRTQLSLGYSLGALSFGVLQPWIGRLIDRHSSRSVIIPSVALTGLALASLYVLGDSLWQFLLTYAAIGALGAGTGMTGYVKVISNWFDKRRGLALGLTIAGFGVGASVMPSLAHGLIAATDWRTAYLLLGLIVVVVTVPVVGGFLREHPRQMGLAADGAAPAADPAQRRRSEQDLDVRQARRTLRFWLMVVAFFLVSLAIHACIIHLIPILTDRGVSSKTAALAASVLGIALIFARVGTGFLLDKFNAAYVGAGIFVISAGGLVLLLIGMSGGSVYLAVLLVGLAFGAESDVIAYMVSRYFGLSHMSEIYGYFYAIYILGAVLGPLLMGAAYDLRASYASALVTLTVFMLVASAILMRLGTVEPDKL